LFAAVDEYADDKGLDKISPLEVADWLEGLSNRAAASMAKVPAKDTPEFRRWQLDVAIQSGLGRFFAGKIRAAVYWRKFERDRDPGLLRSAVQQYTIARNAWSEFANLAKDRYSNDISYGYVPHMRGHWLDRLAEIDGDLEDMKKHGYTKGQAHKGASPHTTRPAVHHTVPARFKGGETLDISLLAAKDLGPARMYYRHVNQAEHWRSLETQWKDGAYRAAIPGEYTQSPFPLQYYFALGHTVFPGFGDDLCGVPYFVVRS
jgi:hypothetical protein